MQELVSFQSIEEMDAHIQERIDADPRIQLVDGASNGSVPETLVKVNSEGHVSIGRVKAGIFAAGSSEFAGENLEPIAELTSNDPDDAQNKINEVITALNLQRTG